MYNLKRLSVDLVENADHCEQYACNEHISVRLMKETVHYSRNIFKLNSG